MERKIGEIFEYDGEWYQCIIGNVCKNCAFNEMKCYTIEDNGYPIGNCCADRRKDNKDVIFKKLEKIGEPYKLGEVLIQQYQGIAPVVLPEDSEFSSIFRVISSINVIEIQIKQTKEDMEEKNNAKHSNSEKIGKNLKEFDLEAAKSGKPVCTRDGRKARIICFDAKDDKERYIIALVDSLDCKKELAYTYDNSGKCCFNYSSISNDDLMMLPEKKEGWVNVYKKEQNRYVKGIFPSREIALNSISEKSREYIDTVKINWSE